MKTFNYIIIGSGITGTTIGRLLQLASEENFCILEKSSVPGGLCRTEIVQDHVLDTGGGHFLCSKHQEVYDFIFSHISLSEFNTFKRQSKIHLEDNIIDYPVESNIWQLPPDLQEKYLASIKAAGSSKNTAAPKSYMEWIRWRLGDRIADEYMIPYNRKIWGVEPAEMDIDWLEKIPKLSPTDIAESIKHKLSNRDKFPSHGTFYYPKEGGFQRIYDAIHSPLREKIQFDFTVRSIARSESYWQINDSLQAPVIINTAPWPSLEKPLAPPSDLQKDFLNLKSNSIVVSLIEEKYEHDYHWLYEPDIDVKHHREFFIHNFAPHSSPTGIYLETNKDRWNEGSAVSKFNKRPLYEHVNETAYPIPSLGHANAIKSILDYYTPKNFYGIGRWGQWKYFNSDVCIFEALKFVRETLNLKPNF